MYFINITELRCHFYNILDFSIFLDSPLYSTEPSAYPFTTDTLFKLLRVLTEAVLPYLVGQVSYHCSYSYFIYYQIRTSKEKKNTLPYYQFIKTGY